MFEIIVVPLDGSRLAEESLPIAEEVARRFDSRLVLAQAVESLAQRLVQPPVVMEAPASTAMSVEVLQKAVDAEKSAAHAYLSGMKERMGGAGIDVEAFVGEGPATDVILEVAREQGAGLIVMTTHGRGGLGRLVFGSVADGVLKRSEVPVLLRRSKGVD
jgi:nucleotide-binding universal stress UspA family protein